MKRIKLYLYGILVLACAWFMQSAILYAEEEPEMEQYEAALYNNEKIYFVEEKANVTTYSRSISNKDIIWDYFTNKGFSAAGIAGIMGNLQAESGFAPNNLENAANNKSGYTDAEFTSAVDNGTISRAQFISSSEFSLYTYTNSTGTYYTYGYGLAQWTFYSRKAALYDFWQNYGGSIGNINMQLDFMYSEMSSSLKNYLKNAINVSDACVKFHNVYEGSADTAAQIAGRVANAEAIYKEYGNEVVNPTISSDSTVYKVGENVTLKRNEIDNATYYLLTVWHQDEQILSASMPEETYELENLEEGEYRVFLEVGNDVVSVESAEYKFYVTDGCIEHTYDDGTVTLQPTCKAAGVKEYECIECGETKTESIKAPGHSYEKYLVKATLSKNGKDGKKCSVCDYVASTVKTVYYPKTFKLSTTEYTYNGEVRKPSVTVKDSKGNKLVKDTDYTVSYEKGRKAPGTYTVKITFKGKYEGTKRLYFTIAPKKVSGVSATQTTTTITLKWKKVTGADGYRVYKYDSSSKKYVKVKDVTGTSLKISKLKAGTAYKFKVRAYTKDDGTIWGANSSVFATATKPKTPSITKISSSSKGKASLTWSNVSGESGYQVYYSSKKDSGFKKVASYKVNVVKGSKSKLTSGKKYYFKVRAYKKTDSGTVYSSWSTVKSIKIK